MSHSFSLFAIREKPATDPCRASFQPMLCFAVLAHSQAKDVP